MKTGDIRIDKIMPDLNPAWETVDFENTLDNIPTASKIKLTSLCEVGLLPVIDQGENFIAGYIDNIDYAYSGELPVIIFGDHTRRFKLIDFPFCIGADGCKILKPKPFLDIRFFYNYLWSLNIVSNGYSRHYKFLKEIKVPIPELSEQRRIVARLETLLSGLNNAANRLGKIPVILRRFRQSVLSAACSGRLTAEWREGKDLPEWVDKKIGDICDTQLGKMLSKKAYESGLEMRPYLRNANVQWGKIDIEDVNKMGFSKREIEKFSLKNGDILMCEGGDVGRCAIWENKLEDCLYQKALHRIRPKDRQEIIAKWIYYVFNHFSYNGELYKDISETTIRHLPQDRLVEILVPLPPLPEQEEIVRRVDALFALSNSIEQRYNATKATLARAEKAIYKKAFSGEL